MDAVRLRQLVCYLPKSGVFFRRDAYQGRCRVVGICADGDYATLTLDGASYMAHRLAWLYVHGVWPDGVVDHINGNRSDNRLSNLRVVTAWQNALNNRVRRRDGGLTGAYWIHDSRWEAISWVNGKKKLLGFYPTEELAHRAYVEFNASIGRVAL
jgi:hypothetical protein